MSCFAVSRLTGRLKNRETSPALPDFTPHKTNQNVSSGVGNKRKSNNIPSVEIVQEVVQVQQQQQHYAAGLPPMPPPRESSMTPIPPSSPQPSPYHQHSHYYYGQPQQQQQQQQRHMSPHRSCSGSVPPSPALSGCRSPSRQRKNAYSTLEVQNAALSAMKDEMLELAARLSRVTKDRDYMEKALNRLQLEKLRMAKEKDDQLDSTTARYEERQVELHSVIAELSRQVEERARDQIAEEDTDEDDDEDDETVGGQHDVALASRTSTEVNAQAVEAGQRLAHQLEIGGSGSDLCAFLRMSRSTASQSMHNSSTTSLQYLALQEELSDAKERNVQLAARLQQREADLNEARNDLEAVAKEKETIREKVCQLEEKLVMAPALSPVRKSSSEDKSSLIQDAADQVHPSCRIAERKKIKKIAEEDQDTDDEGNFGNPQPVTGSDLLSVGVRNSVVVEHLVQDLQDKSSMQEFQHSFASASSPMSMFLSNGSNLKKQDKRRSALLENKFQEFEIEMERLSSRIEHLKSQNEVLNLTLTESKNHCDNLTVLIGKYESNHIAQQLIISYLDHVIESFEVVVALLEAEVVLGRCTTGSSEMIKQANPDIEQAQENRQAAENMAKKLVKILDSVIRPDSGLALPSSMESGTGPGSWDDSSGYSQATGSSLGSNCGGLVTSSIGSFVFQTSVTAGGLDTSEAKTEEVKLREIIVQLKSTRASIQSTIIQELETHHPEHEQIGGIESKTADLEMAVLVQELMAMREEKADLRAQVYLMEKEKKSLELIISSQQAQEHALKTHIRHLQDELENQDSMADMDSEASFQHRNDEMKSRITELLTTLEKVKRNSELRQQQSDDLIKDLKKSNQSLIDALDKTKKKYESRLKHMEQQVLQTLIRSDEPSTARPLLTNPSDMDSCSNKSDSD